MAAWSSRSSRLSRLSVVIVALLVACGGKKEAPPEPSPAPEKLAAEPTKAPPAPETKAAEPAPEPKPAEDAAPAPTDSGFPSKIEDKPTTLVTATPGTVVKNPVPDSPEWLIQQVLVAALDPDEAKGWERYVSLLAEDQKIEKALRTRRDMNFAASRRKVKLFIDPTSDLAANPAQVVYKVDRVVEETPTQVRIFVHNNSEEGMPTPCELRLDENTKKWRVGICSL